MSASDIEHFVRGTLGCGCPDEVFRSTAIRQIPATARRSAHVELLVGSRLLIQIFEAPRVTGSTGWLEQAVTDGRAARDRHGYNRYRLVLVVPAPVQRASDRNDLVTRFARASTGDERSHLHLLTNDQLPPSLRPPPTGPARLATSSGT